MKMLLIPLICFLTSCSAIMNDPEIKADIKKTEQDVIKDVEKSIVSPQTITQARASADQATEPNPTPGAPT